MPRPGQRMVRPISTNPLHGEQATNSTMKTLLEEPMRLERQGESDPRIELIVVATDLSEHAMKTTNYALALAKQFGASLTLVHVFDPKEINFTTPQSNEDFENARRHAELALLNEFEEIERTYPHCGWEFRVGEPVKQIALMTSTLNADLLVIGRHHHNLLAGLFGADAASRLLHTVGCSVLVYR
jgi:nucleotide-binding universal stress UspA family protein